MATVIDLAQSQSHFPRSHARPNPPALASRPLPFFVAIAVVVLFFAGVRQVQHGPAADAAVEPSSSSSVAAVVVPARVEVGFESLDGRIGSTDSSVAVITVGEGDSLWSIASELQPDSDPRPLVAAMIDANGGSLVQIGQEIVIPVRLIGESTALR